MFKQLEKEVQDPKWQLLWKADTFQVTFLTN